MHPICQLQLKLPHPLPISASSRAYANQISTSPRNNRQCNTCGGNCVPLEKYTFCWPNVCLFRGFRLSRFSHCSFFPPVKWKTSLVPWKMRDLRLEDIFSVTPMQTGHLASHREKVLAGFQPTACVFVSGSGSYNSVILPEPSAYWGLLILSSAFVRSFVLRLVPVLWEIIAINSIIYCPQLHGHLGSNRSWYDSMESLMMWMC